MVHNGIWDWCIVGYIYIYIYPAVPTLFRHTILNIVIYYSNVIMSTMVSQITSLTIV